MGQPDPPTPWALAIETSNPSSHDDPPAAGVAACRFDDRGEAFDFEQVSLAPGGRHDDGLLPAIESLRARLLVSPVDLVRVCVSIGPGGYTGLRVAVTTAKLIAEATGAALAGVPSASVAAVNAEIKPPFAVCLASKRGAAHATVFGLGDRPLEGRPVGLIDEQGLEGLGVGSLIADRFLPASMREHAHDLGITIRSPRFSAAACLRLGLSVAPVDPSVLTPVYARKPEAVRLWNARRPG